MSVRVALEQHFVLNQVRQRSVHTPDILELREYDTHLVFVHDAMKQGFWDHKQFLDKAEYLGRGITVKTQWRMKRGHSYPLVFDCNYKKGDYTMRRIFGEVYAVPHQVIVRLDIKNCNNTLRERSKEYIHLLDQNSPLKSKGPIAMSCWMYTAIPEIWEGSFNKMGDVTTHKHGDHWCYDWQVKSLIDAN